TNNRDVYLLSTNDSNIALPGFDTANWNSVIPGIQYLGGTAVLELHVADVQGFGDGGVVLNGVEVVAAGPNFQGNTVPPNVGDVIPLGSGAGGLWDIRSWDIPSGALVVGTNTATLTSPTASDCLSLVVAAVIVPRPSTSVPVNVTGTYLLTNQDPNATAAQAISLSSLDISPGDTLRLQSSGLVNFCQPGSCDFTNRPNPAVVGAFTGGGVPDNSSVLPTGLAEFGTPPTLFGSLSTDIPGDFGIFGSGVTVTVPVGATTLWVILDDSFFGD